MFSPSLYNNICALVCHQASVHTEGLQLRDWVFLEMQCLWILFFIIRVIFRSWNHSLSSFWGWQGLVIWFLEYLLQYLIYFSCINLLNVHILKCSLFIKQIWFDDCVHLWTRLHFLISLCFGVECFWNEWVFNFR